MKKRLIAAENNVNLDQIDKITEFCMRFNKMARKYRTDYVNAHNKLNECFYDFCPDGSFDEIFGYKLSPGMTMTPEELEKYTYEKNGKSLDKMIDYAEDMLDTLKNLRQEWSQLKPE